MRALAQLRWQLIAAQMLVVVVGVVVLAVAADRLGSGIFAADLRARLEGVPMADRVALEAENKKK